MTTGLLIAKAASSEHSPVLQGGVSSAQRITERAQPATKMIRTTTAMITFLLFTMPTAVALLIGAAITTIVLVLLGDIVTATFDDDGE